MHKNARRYGSASLAKVVKTPLGGYSFLGWEIKPVKLDHGIVYATIDNNRVLQCVFKKRSIARSWLIELSRRSAAGYRVSDVLDHLYGSKLTYSYPDTVFIDTYANL